MPIKVHHNIKYVVFVALLAALLFKVLFVRVCLTEFYDPADQVYNWSCVGEVKEGDALEKMIREWIDKQDGVLRRSLSTSAPIVGFRCKRLKISISDRVVRVSVRNDTHANWTDYVRAPNNEDLAFAKCIARIVNQR